MNTLNIFLIEGAVALIIGVLFYIFYKRGYKLGYMKGYTDRNQDEVKYLIQTGELEDESLERGRLASTYLDNTIFEKGSEWLCLEDKYMECSGALVFLAGNTYTNLSTSEDTLWFIDEEGDDHSVGGDWLEFFKSQPIF